MAKRVMIPAKVSQSGFWGDEKIMTKNYKAGSLVESFGAPPFTVLDTRQGYWQDRKRFWISLGIKSELGRSEGAMTQAARHGGGMSNRLAPPKSLPKTRGGTLLIDQCKQNMAHNVNNQGTSIFDPVLCELVYRWFCPPKGKVLDPFAGGSVRGIVATKMGFNYVGIDLSFKQIFANREQAREITPNFPPTWIAGDSRQVKDLTTLGTHKPPYDLIFTCPPYYDLEVYSDDKRDLSNASSYEIFLKDYAEITNQIVSLLNMNRFICYVVSEIRGEDGYYRGLVRDTISIFEQIGARFYNEAVLINQAGSLPVRIKKQFQAGRKLGRMHQYLLVFVKGDWQIAAQICENAQINGRTTECELCGQQFSNMWGHLEEHRREIIEAGNLPNAVRVLTEKYGQINNDVLAEWQKEL